jgi:tRNA (Thr-GGU) A37 N-methylase
LVKVEGFTLHLLDVDVLDGTPLLDIKPWVPEFDVRQQVRSGWLEETQKKSRSMKSDQRFVES